MNIDINDVNIKQKVSDYLYSLTDNKDIHKRIRICLKCKWFSYMQQKCTECSCMPKQWQGVDKLLNKNYKCPEGWWN